MTSRELFEKFQAMNMHLGVDFIEKIKEEAFEVYESVTVDQLLAEIGDLLLAVDFYAFSMNLTIDEIKQKSINRNRLRLENIGDQAVHTAYEAAIAWQCAKAQEKENQNE